jgi:hypothetical protein
LRAQQNKLRAQLFGRRWAWLIERIEPGRRDIIGTASPCWE